MGGNPRVTIGVPVFRGESMVADALNSVASQTFGDFKVVVSVDGGDEASASVCRPFERDPRFTVVVQPRRLDWYGNLNWLRDQLDTEFFVYLSQDDRLAPDFLPSLVATADRHSDAGVVYSDVHWSDSERSMSEPEILGTPLERVIAQLQECHWLPIHGLQRSSLIGKTGPLIVDSPDSVFEDIVWVTKALRHGASRRVPRPLYIKRRHLESVTGKQGRWQPERARRAWLHAWKQILSAALPAAGTPDDARRILFAALSRVALRAPSMNWLINIARLSRDDRRALAIDFLKVLRDDDAETLPRLLGDDWERIAQWSLRTTGLAPGFRGRLRWSCLRLVRRA